MRDGLGVFEEEPLLAAGVVLLGIVGVAVRVGPGSAVQIGEGSYAAGPASGGLGRFLVARGHFPPPAIAAGPIESASRRRERKRDRERLMTILILLAYRFGIYYDYFILFLVE